MKRDKLCKQLRPKATDIREGGNHTKYYRGQQFVAVPRHNEIAEGTARAILRRAAVIGLLALPLASILAYVF